MAEPVTNELIYAVLKSIQTDIIHIRGRADDHDQQLIGLREQMQTMHRSLQTQIHDLQENVLRLEKNQGAMLRDVDQIKRRLDLTDAE